MGRLKQRLERRKGPLFPPAREMAHLAVAAAQGDEDAEDDLDTLTANALDDLDPDEFEELLTLAQEEAELADDSDGGVLMLNATAGHFATYREDDEGEACTWLFAVPLVLTSGATEMPGLTEEAVSSIEDLLCQNDLVDEECEVRILPRLLTPAEVMSLRPGQLYTLMLMLGECDDEAALEYLAGLPASAERAEAVPRADGQLQWLGVVVGVATSEGAFPFVLARAVEVEHTALHAAGEIDPQAQKHEELYQDLRSTLDEAQGPWAAAMGVDSVDLQAPADRWYEVAPKVADYDRVARARNKLRRLAQEHCEGDLSHLSLQPPEVSEGVARFPILRATDEAVVGTVDWPELADEDWRVAMFKFIGLARGLGVQPNFDAPDEEVPEGPLH